MAGFKFSHVGPFVFHATTVSVLLSRGAISREEPLRHVIRHRLLFRPEDCFCFRSEDWYKDHPNFKVLYHDADGDGKKDFGDRRIFDQVNVNRKRK
jgi:hypothetical protein